MNICRLITIIIWQNCLVLCVVGTLSTNIKQKDAGAETRDLMDCMCHAPTKREWQGVNRRRTETGEVAQTRCEYSRTSL
ncbi:hypothetical protein V8C40DRAFT_254100 [Trichoderma camerunense]